MHKKIYKIGLKANANFLFTAMLGDTLGGYESKPLFRSVVILNTKQFEKFKNLIILFNGNLKKSLVKDEKNLEVDYQCYFCKNN